MAERVGFEPTVRRTYTRSPGVHLRPLGHLSASGSFGRWKERGTAVL